MDGAKYRNIKGRPHSAGIKISFRAFSAGIGGIPTRVLGPGDSGLAHQTDEYCAVAAIDGAVDIYEMIAAH